MDGGVDGVRCRRTGLGALRPRLWWLWDTPPVAPYRFRRIRLDWVVVDVDRLTWCVIRTLGLC
jgi:hypothetical protein